MRKGSSFRPHSEWDEPASNRPQSEWNQPSSGKRSSAAVAGRGGGNGGGDGGDGGVDENTTRIAQQVKRRLYGIALAKGKNGKPDYKATFRIFDVDNSGLINKMEFKRGLEKCDLDLTRQEIQQLQNLYFGGDTMLSYDNWLAAAKKQEDEKRRKQWEDEDGWEGFDYITCGFFY